MADVHTHPPLLVKFPLRTAERKRGHSQFIPPTISGELPNNGNGGDGEAVDSLNSPSRVTSSAFLSDLEHTAEDTPHLVAFQIPPEREELQDAHPPHNGGMQHTLVPDLLDGISQYFSLEDTRMSAYPSSSRASFPSSIYNSVLGSRDRANATRGATRDEEFEPGDIRGDSRSLWGSPGGNITQRSPNGTVDLDLRTLNLHLALRVTEVLGCAEAMWEWVVEIQKKRRQQGQPGRGSVDTVGVRAPGSVMSGGIFAATKDKTMEGIAELTRAEFDGLLFKFEQYVVHLVLGCMLNVVIGRDMRQQMALGKVLQDDYGWMNVHLPPTTDDKACDGAWDEWQEWERRHTQRPTARRSRQWRASVASAAPQHSRPTGPEASRSQTSANGSPSIQQPLCRSLRVFVAWKA
jgi:hypothetical protein